MNGPSAHWLSHVAPKPNISYRQLIDLGALDPYGQHQALWKLFEVAQEKRNGQAEFLFRVDKRNGLPVFYVISRRLPRDIRGLWHIESKPYQPNIQAGDRLAFKLRVNPIVARKEAAGARGKRHDVVMDAKHRMNWKNLPEDQRPTLAHLAHEAGGCWLRGRAERLGCKFEDTTLRADGYQTWRQRNTEGIEISMLDFDGSLIVINPARFADALLNGVGPAKGFGCGLLMVRRV